MRLQQPSGRLLRDTAKPLGITSHTCVISELPCHPPTVLVVEESDGAPDPLHLLEGTVLNNVC